MASPQNCLANCLVLVSQTPTNSNGGFLDRPFHYWKNDNASWKVWKIGFQAIGGEAVACVISEIANCTYEQCERYDSHLGDDLTHL